MNIQTNVFLDYCVAAASLCPLKYFAVVGVINHTDYHSCKFFECVCARARAQPTALCLRTVTKLRQQNYLYYYYHTTAAMIRWRNLYSVFAQLSLHARARAQTEHNETLFEICIVLHWSRMNAVATHVLLPYLVFYTASCITHLYAVLLHRHATIIRHYVVGDFFDMIMSYGWG